jgi:WD40 repeat protein
LAKTDLDFSTFTTDGSRLVTSDVRGTVTVWDYLNGVAVRTFQLTPGFHPIPGSLSPDGSKLVAAANYETPVMIHVIDLNSGITLATLKGHTKAIGGVAFLPDGGRLATGSYDGSVKIWNMNTESALQTIQITTAHTYERLLPVFSEIYNGSIAVSSDSRWLATGSIHGPVRIWELAAGRLAATLTRRGNWQAVAFSPDGRRLVIGGDGRTPHESGL